MQGGYRAAKALTQAHPAMTALLVTNYEMTLGAVIALNELGLTLGREMSMIGFDNMQLSQVVKPGLCVVEQPLKDMGAALAGRMMERAPGRGRPFAPGAVPEGPAVPGRIGSKGKRDKKR